MGRMDRHHDDNYHYHDNNYHSNYHKLYYHKHKRMGGLDLHNNFLRDNNFF